MNSALYSSGLKLSSRNEVDKFDKATRSRVMARVRSKDTNPEMLVRSAAHKLGFRFRLHRKDLPGKPDMVFPSRHIALFVHGCFWHGHDCPRGQLMPVTNANFWRNKLSGNIKRDAKVKVELIKLGWQPIAIWQCQTKGSDLPKILTRLLKQRVLKDKVPAMGKGA